MEHEQPQQLPTEPTAPEQRKKIVIVENGVERTMTPDEVRAALKKTVEVRMVRVSPETGEKTDA